MADISAVVTSNGDTYNLKDATARESLVPSGGTTGQVLTKTASGYGWADASGGGGGTWGDITGTLSDQTDLQTALDAKQDTLTAGNNITINSSNVISTPTEVLYGVATNTGSSTNLSCTITYSQAQDAIDAGHVVIILLNSTRYIYSYSGTSGTQFYCPIQAQTNTYNIMVYSTSRLAISTQILYFPWSHISSKPTLVSKDVVLASASWSSDTYTISDSDITATSTVTLTYPANTSATDYTALQDADIRATAQADGSLTLQALGTVPTSDLTITLVIQNGW